MTREEVIKYVQEELKKGVSTYDIAQDLALKGVTDSKGQPIKRKYVNNILTHLKIKIQKDNKKDGMKM